ITSVEGLIEENLKLSAPNNDWSKVGSQSASFNLKTIIVGKTVSDNDNELSQEIPNSQKLVSSVDDTIINIILTNESGSNLIRFEGGEYFGISSIPSEKIDISPVFGLKEKREDYVLMDSIWNAEPAFFVHSDENQDTYIFDKKSKLLIAYLSVSGYGASVTTYRDYREADGFMVPFKKEVLIEQASYSQEYTYQKRAFNPTFDPNHFELDEDWKSFSKGNKIPDFSLPMVADESRMVSSSEIAGKVTLIDFWATWCKPCIEEFPSIEEQYKKYKKKGFEVVSISVDRNIDRPKSFLAKNPFSWEFSLYSAGEFESLMARNFQLVSLPKPILVNDRGEIIALDAELRNGKLASILEEIYPE
ncbi:MAG: TlpA disulfide reductase family protein, partial [Bacteroidota bacterium]